MVEGRKKVWHRRNAHAVPKGGGSLGMWWREGGDADDTLPQACCPVPLHQVLCPKVRAG